MSSSPSARTDRDTAPEIASDRGTTPPQLARSLEGDLDAILIAATEHNPSDRYASVDQFVDELERHNHRWPVHARTHSLSYRATKFFERNKPIVTMAVVLMIGLVGSLSYALISWQSAAHERNVAENMTAVLEDLIATTNPYLKHDEPEQLLGTINERIAGAFPDESGAEARVRFAMGRALAEMWRFNAARDQFQLAVDRSAVAGQSAELLHIRAKAQLARTYAAVCQGEGAIPIAEEAFAAISAHPDATDIERAHAKSILSFALWIGIDEPDFDRAEVLCKEAIATFRADPTASPRGLARALHRLGSLYWEKGQRTDEIRDLQLEALDWYRRSPQGMDRSYAECLRAVSYCYRVAGEIREEMGVLREFTRITPEEFYDTRSSRGVLVRLGMLEHAVGNLERAHDLYRRALRA